MKDALWQETYRGYRWRECSACAGEGTRRLTFGGVVIEVVCEACKGEGVVVKAKPVGGMA
jgi:DnaJ-class molecular chaperone